MNLVEEGHCVKLNVLWSGYETPCEAIAKKKLGGFDDAQISDEIHFQKVKTKHGALLKPWPFRSRI